MGRDYAMGPLGWKSAAILAAAFLTVPCRAAVETTSEPLAASATLLQGNGGTGFRLNMFSLQSISPATYAGAVSAVVPGAISDARARWVQDQFNGVNGAFYIEFASGAKVDVIRTDAASKSLIVSSNLPAPVSVGDTFKIRKHITLSDIFGPHNEAGLVPGLNPAAADNVLLYNSANQQTYTYFYSSVPGYNGWYSDSYAAAAQTIVPPESGIMVRCKTSQGALVVMHGAAKEGVNLAPVYPGFNLLGTLKGERNFKLSELNLYTGDAATGVGAGSNSGVADNLILVRPDSSTATYFYSDYPGFVGWYDATYSPAANVVVPAGSAFFIQRKAPRGSFYWTIPAE